MSKILDTFTNFNFENMPLVAPQQVFPGFASDGTSLTIPLADLPGLSNAEANPTTGNVMEVIRVMLEKLQGELNNLAPTARPTRSTLTKAAPIISPTPGVPPGTLRQVYTLAVDLTPTGLEPTTE